MKAKTRYPEIGAIHEGEQHRPAESPSLRRLLVTSFFALLWLSAWTPAARADAACPTTTLDVIIALGSCSIGSLDYSFSNFDMPSGTPLPPSDFTFTPGTNGFTVSLGSSVSITGVGPTTANYATAELNYTVTGIGGATVTDVAVSCPSMSVSGTISAYAMCANEFDSVTVEGVVELGPIDGVSEDKGVIITSGPSTLSCPASVCTSGSGTLTIFNLEAFGSDTASWDPSTGFAFDSSGGTPTPTPEPSGLTLVAVGLFGLAAGRRIRWASHRPEIRAPYDLLERNSDKPGQGAP